MEIIIYELIWYIGDYSVFLNVHTIKHVLSGYCYKGIEPHNSKW